MPKEITLNSPQTIFKNRWGKFERVSDLTKYLPSSAIERADLGFAVKHPKTYIGIRNLEKGDIVLVFKNRKNL
jgi:hypothetical protein